MLVPGQEAETVINKSCEAAMMKAGSFVHVPCVGVTPYAEQFESAVARAVVLGGNILLY